MSSAIESTEFFLDVFFFLCRCQVLFIGFAGSRCVASTSELCHICGASFISVDLTKVSVFIAFYIPWLKYMNLS